MSLLPVLYSFRRCPYAIRTRMTLKYCAIDVEHREVLLKDKRAGAAGRYSDRRKRRHHPLGTRRA